MGIDMSGTFAYNHGIIGTKLDSTQTKTLWVEIDILRMYYWIIISTLHDNRLPTLNIHDYAPLPGEACIYVSPQDYIPVAFCSKTIGLPYHQSPPTPELHPP